MIASCYNDWWISISYLDEIETEHTACINSANKTEITYKDISIIEDIFQLAKIGKIFKLHKTKGIDFEPIYENSICFYLNYDYDGNIKNFTEKLNEVLKEIVDNRKILDWRRRSNRRKRVKQLNI